MNKFNILFLLLIIFFMSSVFSQKKDHLNERNHINQEILKMDSILFDVAFNTGDSNLYKKIITSDFEFYNDRSVMSTTIEKETKSIDRQYSRPKGLTRRLVSSDTYELGESNAVQIGEHDFYIENTKVQSSKFITYWERQDDSWIITRTISYGHQDTLEG